MAIAALLAPVSALAAPPAGFVVTAQSEHFTFYSRQADSRPDVTRTERFLVEMERTLGVHVAGQAPYYMVEHPADVFAASGVYTEGVTDLVNGDIMSVRSYHPHEIVHRVAADLGNPGLFFHEGLAVALGDRGRLQGEKVDKLARRAARRVSPRDAIERFRELPQKEAYALAGSFVAYLLRHDPPERLAEFFRACGRTGKPCAAAFARVFGRSLDDALASWQDSIT